MEQEMLARDTSKRAATIGGIGSILFWCWSGVCFTQGGRLLGAMPYLALMTATGTLTVAVLHVCGHRRLSELIALPPRVVIAGFWGVAVYTVCLAWAFSAAEPHEIGQINLLNYLWPIWIVLLGSAMLKGHRCSPSTFLGALLGFGGVIISRGVEDLFHIPNRPLPHIVALVGSFLWALYCILLQRWRIREEDGGTALNFAMCSIMAAGLATWRGEWTSVVMTPKAVFWILFGGIGPVGLGYHWWETGMKRGAVRFLGLLAYFIPVGSSILIGLFFRKSMNLGLIPGAMMIAIGAWFAGRKEKMER